MTCELLTVSASNGENLKLAERFAASGRRRGQHSEVLDLTALNLPLFTPRAQLLGTPAELALLQERLLGAPRWVICAPEYNGSIPPVLTSAIAWLSVQGDDFRTVFNNRPIALASHSGGGGGKVLTVMRIQLAHLGALVLGRQLGGTSANPVQDSSIDDLVNQLLQLNPAPPAAALG